MFYLKKKGFNNGFKNNLAAHIPLINLFMADIFKHAIFFLSCPRELVTRLKASTPSCVTSDLQSAMTHW